MNRWCWFVGLACALIIVTCTCAQCQTKGHREGNIVTLQPKLLPFTQLRLEGSFNVKLAEGDSPALRIEAEANLLSQLEVQQEQSELIIRKREGGQSHNRCNLFITYQQLSLINIVGEAELVALSKLQADTLRLELQGETTTSLHLQVGTLLTHITGHGIAHLWGQAVYHKLTVAGAVNVDAANLDCQQVQGEFSGSGSSVLRAQNTLNLLLVGVQEVTLKGNPGQVSIENHGTGRIRRLGDTP